MALKKLLFHTNEPIEKRKEKFTRLIDEGANTNERDKDGSTSLHNAIFYRNLQLIPFLVSSGVDINAVDRWGDTALHDAVRYKLYNGVVVLCEYGAKVNIANEYGDTVLHRLAYNNHIAITRIILARVTKADLALKNNCEHTAYEIADYKKSDEVALLIEEKMKELS